MCRWARVRVWLPVAPPDPACSALFVLQRSQGRRAKRGLPSSSPWAAMCLTWHRTPAASHSMAPAQDITSWRAGVCIQDWRPLWVTLCLVMPNCMRKQVCLHGNLRRRVRASVRSRMPTYGIPVVLLCSLMCRDCEYCVSACLYLCMCVYV